MNAISSEVMSQLFTEARSHNAWQSKEVSDDILKKLYELTKWGPTAANTTPARFVFVKSKPEKEKLILAVAEMNQEKVRTAPVTAIIAADQKFFDLIPKLFPHAPGMRDHFTSSPPLVQESAMRNSSLQGGYFIMAARALGLDVGPMSGFDNKKLDELFFGGSNWKSNFICNLGYADHSKLFPRLPRLTFEEACKIV